MRDSGLRSDLARLARFGANVSDSHSCFIFLPSGVSSRLVHLNAGQGASGITAPDSLSLVGAHSLSKEIASHCDLPLDAGLIGWVAKHGRAIHVSPFDRSSSTLGVYTADQELKSFIGVPVAVALNDNTPPLFGVIACDSKKSFAFSKLQGKLLEELAEQVSCVVGQSLKLANPSEESELSWESFVRLGAHLIATVGAESLQLIRVKALNIPELERALGVGGCLKLLAQIGRLVQQTVPPGTPICKLANGDLLIAVDNMMVSYYESRFEALAGHAREQGHRALLGYDRLPCPPSRSSSSSPHESFDAFVNESLGIVTLEPEKIIHEHRRA